MADNEQKITIYDVAKATGTSISTVSRVLNAPDKVNPETRQKIQEAIDQLGFVPKAEARMRALRNNGRIGVITPFFTAPAFVQRLRGIAGVLAGTNFELIIYTVESHEQLLSYVATLPLIRRLDGLIIISLPIEEEDIQRLIKYHLPVVLIEYPHPSVSCVEIDDVDGGRQAGEFLIKKGHTKIAFLGDTDLPEYAIHPVSLRLVGFRQALKAAGIDLPENFTRLAPYSLEQTQKLASELLALPDPPTAIFAATDLQALGVLKAARQLAIKVPDQLAVIGFDDLDMADYADLTTVSQHLDDSGCIAAEILLANISHPNRPAQHIKLSLEIVERSTT
jgi:DNA-binding LacI/PurR family transcriptional regulator